MGRSSIFPGGDDRASLEARFEALSAQLRRLTVQYSQQAVQQAVQIVAKTIDVVNYSDLRGIPTSFNPSAHAATHAIGGSDPLTPAMIGAADGGLNGGAALDYFLVSVDASTETEGIADGGNA